MPCMFIWLITSCCLYLSATVSDLSTKQLSVQYVSVFVRDGQFNSLKQLMELLLSLLSVAVFNPDQAAIVT